MMPDQIISKRGGARAGAGRKAVAPEARLEARDAALYPAQWAALEALALARQTSVAAVLRGAIDAELKRATRKKLQP